MNVTKSAPNIINPLFLCEFNIKYQFLLNSQSTITLFLEIKSPNYPKDSGSKQTCEFTLESVDGSRLSLNFLDMDILQRDGGTCEFDYVKLIDKNADETSLIGKDGKDFCGLHVPNYPGPSVYVSSKYLNTLYRGTMLLKVLYISMAG